MTDWTPIYSAPGGWVTVLRQRVSTPAGSRWQYAVSTGATSGAVALVTRGDEVLLVQSERPVLGTLRLWEFPRGFGEDVDRRASRARTYEATARRELVEETALKGGTAYSLGVVHPNSGLLTEMVGVVQISDPDGTALAKDEIDDIRWVSWRRLWTMVQDGEITDSFTLSAMALFHAHRGSTHSK